MLLKNLFKSRSQAIKGARMMSGGHHVDKHDHHVPNVEHHNPKALIIKTANNIPQKKFKHHTVHKNDVDFPYITYKDIENAEQEPLPKSEQEIYRLLAQEPGSQERTDFFYGLAKLNHNDHEEIKKAKLDIKRLIDEELEFLGFQNDLKAEEQAALVNETWKNVEERSSFFFKYNANKANVNLKIFDEHAPGNIHKHISIVVPHEHVHPQHQIDAQSMTQEDIQQLYALYTYYVDLHISQIRHNIDEVSYIPPQFNQMAHFDSNETSFSIDNKFFEFYHRYREPGRTWKSKTQQLDHEKLLASLPEDHHPDPRKISQHEIEFTEAEKFPHVANRKGYPIMAEEPFERILGLERLYAHPSYQIQPFVQTPSMDPDPTLNFEQAETVYENKTIGEWIRMWRWIMAGTLPFWPAFFTFEIYQADGVPSLDWLSDIASWHGLPKQFQDSGDWNLYEARYVDEHNYMNLPYAIKRSMARPAHTMYQASLIYFLCNLNFNYATKVTYNKDKDLVFVNMPTGWFRDHESVYEMHHLETTVPNAVSSYQHMGVARKDGILNVKCLDTNDNFKLYNDPKYWNLELRDEFFAQTRTMWVDLCDKYNGRVVSISQRSTPKEDEMDARITRELHEAIEKHGKVQPVIGHREEVGEAMINKRKELFNAATA